MGIVVVALILDLAVILFAILADMLAPVGTTNLNTALVIFLICIPVSLALFAFLAHDQKEDSKFNNQGNSQEALPPRLLND